MSLYYHGPRIEDRNLSRRQLLCKCGMGMGALGLAGLLGPELVLSQNARAEEISRQREEVRV